MTDFDRAAQDYFDPPDSEPCDECSGTRWPKERHEEHCSLFEDTEDEAYERYRDIERMERESEQAMEEAAAGLEYGGSE